MELLNINESEQPRIPVMWLWVINLSTFWKPTEKEDNFNLW